MISLRSAAGVYEDDWPCDGVAFMQGLVRFDEHRGLVVRYPQPDAAEPRVYRVPAPRRGLPRPRHRSPQSRAFIGRLRQRNSDSRRPVGIDRSRR